MKKKLETMDLVLVGLVRDGADTWLCDIETPEGQPVARNVTLRGADEDEAARYASQNIHMIQDLIVDSTRLDRNGQTGILVRARLGSDWGAYDIATLTRESFRAWLGSSPDLAVRTLEAILDYRFQAIKEAFLDSRGETGGENTHS